MFVFLFKVVTLRARYEVPVTLFEGMETEPINLDNEIYTVDMKRTPFGLIVKRKKTNRPLQVYFYRLIWYNKIPFTRENRIDP